jgi:hypothetical protein
MRSDAKTVRGYLDELPPGRCEAVDAVRVTVLAALPVGYEEVMSFGLIAYVIPQERYPATYNKEPLMLAALANQKRYMALYLMNVYGDSDIERWFTDRYQASGKRLDMGKSCVRFRSIDDLPLDVVGEAIARTSVPRTRTRTSGARVRGTAEHWYPPTPRTPCRLGLAWAGTTSAVQRLCTTVLTPRIPIISQERNCLRKWIHNRAQDHRNDRGAGQ